MEMALSPGQRRVLGVLIEKSLTTPDQYPLTLNAIVAGANQKSNRDPVTDYSESQIIDVLQELRHKGLTRQADPRQGSRAVRFEHLAGPKCGWAPREQAVLGELLLRGPQTVGELRTRAGRMKNMPDIDYVQGILGELANNDPPLVRTVERAAGQSAIRYAHTLYPDGEQPAAASVPQVTSKNASPALLEELSAKIANLEARVAALEANTITARNTD